MAAAIDDHSRAQRRRVYIYTHDLRSNGVVRDAVSLSDRLARDFEVTLVAGFGDGLWSSRLEDAASYETVVLATSDKRPTRVLAVRLLRGWLRNNPPGLLLSIGNYCHVTSYLATRGLAHIRRLYRISNEVVIPGRSNWLVVMWMRLLMSDAVGLILVGRSLARRSVFADAVTSRFAVPLPSGVDTRLASSQATAPLPHEWFQDDIPVIIAVGRLRPQKNHDLLIEAIGVARRRVRVRLVIVGAGSTSERSRLATLAASAGLGEDMLLAGETENVFAWLARSSVFVLPSRWEGSSLALLEAMAVGTPVVASWLAGDASDVLDGGRYGLLVAGNDPEELADAILRQLSDARVTPAKRAMNYELAHVGDLYARVIASACEEHASARTHDAAPSAHGMGRLPPVPHRADRSGERHV